VTAYLLASTVVGPMYGKLGDLYGRKILLQTAILIFLVGSALCGISQNMIELIVFRAIQGLGGGGLFVITIAVVGDIIPPRDRGRYQGYFGGVFGVSTVLGPLLGGFFVDNLSWRWIFYVNVPIGLLALAVIATAFQARTDQVRHTIDYAGAVLLAGGLSAIVLFTSLGGTTYAWGSAQMVALIVAGVVLLAAFVVVEARAAEPILPLELFRNRVFSATSAVGFIVGLALFGALTYLPLYLQDVKRPQSHHLGASDHADDGRSSDHLDRKRSADQPVRSLQAVPDRRYRDHGRRAGAALTPASRHLDARDRRLHARARTWPGPGHPGARARRPELG
jgi:EmrB/QacA subfamily drug resistance transporter